MREIFTDLYRKLAGFFQAPTEKEEASKDFACNRLKLVLMQDRTNLTPYLLEKMRGELIDLLSRYVEMDKEALELNFAQEGDSMALMLSIPVLRAKDEEEIQALLKEEEEAKAKAEAQKTAEEETEAQEDEESEEGSDYEEESEETDEDLSTEEEEEVCACGIDEEEENPDDSEEVEEQSSKTKSSKKK